VGLLKGGLKKGVSKNFTSGYRSFPLKNSGLGWGIGGRRIETGG
jgi:hypothetical protein